LRVAGNMGIESGSAHCRTVALWCGRDIQVRDDLLLQAHERGIAPLLASRGKGGVGQEVGAVLLPIREKILRRITLAGAILRKALVVYPAAGLNGVRALGCGRSACGKENLRS